MSEASTILPRDGIPLYFAVSEAVERGHVVQYDPIGGNLLTHPRLLPGNWRVGVAARRESRWIAA